MSALLLRWNALELPPPVHASQAEKITWALDGPDGANRRFRKQLFDQLPDSFATSLAGRYVALYENNGERDANLLFLDNLARLEDFTLPLDSSDSDLVEYARARAKECQRMLGHAAGLEVAIAGMERVCLRCGIAPPKTTIQGRLARLTDELWWRRSVRKVYGRALERYAVEAGFIHRKAGLYVSDEGLKRKKEQARRNARALEGMLAVNEVGEEFELSRLVEHSLANPKNRRSELMVRIAGFDAVSQLLMHSAVFCTLTCPSHMHPRLAVSGDENPKFDGKSHVKEGQAYLCSVWSRVRASLQRRGIPIYGFRVAEPHHDGTPHWHLLIWVAPAQRDQMISIFKDYALQDSPDEEGAQEHRFTSELIDPSKGSAAGYIAKYISKNIDGFGLPESEGGKPERVRAWAGIHGIRQFQQFGGPSVGIWRELRRVGGAYEILGLLGEMLDAANKGDWARFVMLMGGPTCKRADMPVVLDKKEVDTLGRYGEPMGKRVQGVQCGGVYLPTRFSTWSIKFKNCTQENTPSSEGVTIKGVPNEGAPKASLGEGVSEGEKQPFKGFLREVPNGGARPPIRWGC